MPVLILDTHVWFWMVSGSRKLSKRHRQLIERAPNDCAICAVSVWEVAMLADKGRIKLNGMPREWLHRARDLWPISVLPVDADVALRANEIQLDTNDPSDHFIAACALLNNAKLLTVDGPMIDAPWLDTV